MSRASQTPVGVAQSIPNYDLVATDRSPLAILGFNVRIKGPCVHYSTFLPLACSHELMLIELYTWYVPRLTCGTRHQSDTQMMFDDARIVGFALAAALKAYSVQKITHPREGFIGFADSG